MSDYYDRKGNVVDMMTWARDFAGDRKVARTDICEGVFVSTVFLGLDHSFGSGEPLIFETLIFGGALDGEMERWRDTRQKINLRQATRGWLLARFLRNDFF